MKKTIIPVITLLGITIILFVANYTPGTWLTGWDNLHSEFDFRMNVVRSLQSVWQEYQGLGLLAGMAHASDLIRQLFLWISSLVIPDAMLRYFYHFLMIFLGSTGVYFLTRLFLMTQNSEPKTHNASLLAALFYIFNLGTIQYFFVPFEPYSTFWGALPWLLLTVFHYLKEQSRKNFTILTIVHLLATPMAYVQTIFLVYAIIIAAILIVHFIRNRTATAAKTMIFISGVIFCVNAFWLLPNLYFVKNDIQTTQNAMQNKMATEKFYEMNKKRGTIADFALLRSFYYDFYDYNRTTDQFDFLMKEWRSHMSNPLVNLIGYLFFCVVILGLLQKNPYRPHLLTLFSITAVVFLSNTPIFLTLNDILRSTPLLTQIFRNPFTKFIAPASLIFAIGFGLGTAKLMQLLQLRVHYSKLITLILIAALIIYAFPAFKGEFLAKQMRVAIPKEYFDLFDYFKTQDKNARIMNLPQGTYWGWYFYRWGARGSGFLWYGIEQPIMDRAFDVWSTPLEGYYWELAYALKKRDTRLFNAIIDKYQISYIIYDDNLMFSDYLNSIKIILKQKDLLANNDKVAPVATFGSVTVYKTKLNYPMNNNVTIGRDLVNTQPPERYQLKDNQYATVGPYYSFENAPEYFYPFGSLFSTRFQNEQAFSIEEGKNTTKLIATIPKGSYRVSIPSLADVERIITIELRARRRTGNLILNLITRTPALTIGPREIPEHVTSQEITISVGSSELQNPLLLSVNNKDFFILRDLTDQERVVGITYLTNARLANYFRLYSARSAKIIPLAATQFQQAKPCGTLRGEPLYSSRVDKDVLTLMVKNTAICSTFHAPLRLTEPSLLQLNLTYKSQTDEFPKYCLFSKIANSCLNRKDSYSFGFSRQPIVISEFFESGDYKNDEIFTNLILEAVADEDKDQKKEIFYQNAVITAYPYLATIPIELERLEDVSKETILSLSENTTITAKIPRLQNSLSYVNPIENNIYKTTALNYDRYMTGPFSLEMADGEDKYLRAKANDASSYLLFRAVDLQAGSGYLLSLTTRNVKGLPFNINIFTNKDFRNYIYTYLPKTEEFRTSNYILPPIYEFDHGVNVLLGNTTYNSQEVVNDLKDLAIYSIPYEFLTNISFRSFALTTTQSTLSTPRSVQKERLYHYSIADEVITEGDMLMLSQSYHKGWKAYAIQGGSLIDNYLPFLFGEEIKEHVVINNWANGWKLDDRWKMVDDGSIILLFLPQYLQYVGFLFLLVPIAVMLKYRVSK